MFTIRKVLNNNSIIVDGDRDAQERILLGKGIGFGKKPGDIIDDKGDAKEYMLAPDDERSRRIGTESGIDPRFIETAGRIIDEARLVFEDLRTDFLLPLADHIAFAAHREETDVYLPNPFIPDIKLLFEKEYSIAWKCKDMIKELAGYEVTEDEAGFIALHIHSGLSHEAVSETMRYTQIINSAMKTVERACGHELDKNAFTYTRLESHLYYMVMRIKNHEKVNVNLNEYMRTYYSKAYRISLEICEYMADQLSEKLDPEESGYLAVHIQRLIAED